MQFVIIVTIFYILLVLIAILVGDIGPIFNIIGSISANAISYILPSLFYIQLAKKKDYDFYFSIMIVIISTILGMFCLIS